MGNRGDAFWNVSLRGVRDKHSNDLSIRMQYRRSRGRGEGKEKGKRIYLFSRIDDIVDEPKNKIKAAYKSWFSELLTG